MATKHKYDGDPSSSQPPSKRVAASTGANYPAPMPVPVQQPMPSPQMAPSYPPAIIHPPLNSSGPLSNSTGADDPCNLFIKHLPPDMTDASLNALFAPFGTIVSAKVMRNPTSNLSLGYGFVKFGTPEEANNAIAHMSGVRIENKYLLVKHAESGSNKVMRQTQVVQQNDQQVTSLYAAAIQQQLQAYYGDSLPPETMAYYVQYYTQYYRQMARQQQGAAAPGAAGAAGFASNTPGVNLYIFHLPVDIDDNALRTLFSPFGTIESVKVVYDKMTGLSKGYGFVKFARMEDAAQAINTMNGFQIGNKHLKVSFKK